MFELNRALSEWRKTLLGNGSMDGDNVEELECHLRESIDSLGAQGLSEEEAFLIASKRLGYVQNLSKEYGKNSLLGVNQDRLIWMLSGYIGITLCGLLKTAIVSWIIVLMGVAGAGVTVTGITMLGFELLFWAMIFSCMVRCKEAPLVFGKHPTASLLALFFSMLALPFISMLGYTVHLRSVESTWLVNSTPWIGIGQFVIQLLIYAVCFAALSKMFHTKQLALE